MADSLGLLTPSIMSDMAPTQTVTSYTLDASGKAVECVFECETDQAITHLGVRLASITGTSPVYRCSLQNVTAGGDPDGTILASATFDPTSLGWSANSFNWVALSSSYAPSRGQRLAWVIDYSSGTINASNAANIGYVITANVSYGFPYAIQNASGTRTRQANLPIFGYRTATSRHGLPFANTNTNTFHSASASDEFGILFSIPVDWCESYRVKGARFLGQMASTSVAANLSLYQGGGASDRTLLQQVQIDGNRFQATGSNRIGCYFFDESALSTLQAGSSYRLAIAVTSGSPNTIALRGYTLSDANDRSALPWGTYVAQTEAADSGNWTDTTTKGLLLQLILDDITEPVGGNVFSRFGRRFYQQSQVSRRARSIVPVQQVIETQVQIPVSGPRRRFYSPPISVRRNFSVLYQPPAVVNQTVIVSPVRKVR